MAQEEPQNEPEQKLDETEQVEQPAAAAVQKPADDEPTDPLPDDEDNEEPDEPWLTDEDLGAMLNVRWRKVIEERMNGKTMTEAYALAYDIDITKTKLAYNVATSNASRLLRNAKFQRLWDRVNAERGFSDQMADWQLTDLITNPGVEPAVRRAAINDYNKLRGRVVEKVDHTTKGKRIEAPAIISTIKPRDAAATEAEATDGN